jgi:hypothetical protein
MAKEQKQAAEGVEMLCLIIHLSLQLCLMQLNRGSISTASLASSQEVRNHKLIL